ncbi:hypothetical protein HYX08_00320 [Candidatus Woesearchaeota archaeon]|nr:hypothetical protein [Candidatus Woesearchaeota archaeon]
MGYRIINPENIPNLADSSGMSPMPDNLKFDYIGPWRFRVNENGYGMAHRIGLKRRFEVEGVRHLLIAHFGLPIAEQELRIPIGIIEHFYENLNDLVAETAVLAAERLVNVASMHMVTPDYMKMELVNLLLEYSKPSPE